MAKGNVQVTLTAKDEASAKIRNVGKAGDDLRAIFRNIAVAAAAAASAITIAVGKMLNDWADAGDEVAKMAQRTGWGVESLSELAYVAKQSGTDLAAIETSTKKLSSAIVDASDGMETYVRIFDKLGISVDDLLGMSPEDQFWTVAMAMADLTNATERSSIATDLFGRSGTDLLPILAEGASGIADMRQKAHDFNVTYTEESAQAAVDFGDSMSDMKSALDGVKNAIVGESGLAPALTDLINNTINPMLVNLNEFIKENQDLKQSFLDIVDGVKAFVEWCGKVYDIFVKIDEVVPDWLWATNPTLNAIQGGVAKREDFSKGLPGLLPGVEEAFGSQAASVMAGNTSVVNVNINGNVMGDEAAIRQLVAELEPYLAENARRSSFAGVNTSAYYAGSSSK
jgi:hypothetical protein